MRISDLLLSIATYLEDPNNEALLLAEYDDACLSSVAKTCISAATILKQGAEEVEALEPKEPSQLTSEALDDLTQMLNDFDASENTDLQKVASVIDELLLTFADGKAEQLKQAQENRLDVLKDKYENTKKQLDEVNKVKESAQLIDKSPIYKEYRCNEAPLSTRSCPDHAGAQLARVGENMWQCQMDKKVYNWQTGFTNERGDKVPGGDVANQTPLEYPNPAPIFDTRDSRLGK